MSALEDAFDLIDGRPLESESRIANRDTSIIDAGDLVTASDNLARREPEIRALPEPERLRVAALIRRGLYTAAHVHDRIVGPT